MCNNGDCQRNQILAYGRRAPYDSVHPLTKIIYPSIKLIDSLATLPLEAPAHRVPILQSVGLRFAS